MVLHNRIITERVLKPLLLSLSMYLEILSCIILWSFLQFCFIYSTPVWVRDHFCGSIPPSSTICSFKQFNRDSSGCLQIHHPVEETCSRKGSGYGFVVGFTSGCHLKTPILVGNEQKLYHQVILRQLLIDTTIMV